MILLIDMVPIYITKLTYSMKVFEIFNQICIKMKSVLYAIPKGDSRDFLLGVIDGYDHLPSNKYEI